MSECIKFEDMISAYVDGELSAAEEAELTAHLEACSSCGDLLAIYRNLQGFVKENSVDPPAELLANVMAGIGGIAISKPNHRKRIARTSVRYMAVAACIALTIMAVPRILGGSPTGMSASLSTDAGSVIVDTASGEEWTASEAETESTEGAYVTSDAGVSDKSMGTAGFMAVPENGTATEDVTAGAGAYPDSDASSADAGQNTGKSAAVNTSRASVSATSGSSSGYGFTASDTVSKADPTGSSTSEIASSAVLDAGSATVADTASDPSTLAYTALLSDSKYAGIITVTGALPSVLRSSELYANGNGEYHIYIDKYVAGNLLRIGYEITMNAAPMTDKFVVIYNSNA